MYNNKTEAPITDKKKYKRSSKYYIQGNKVVLKKKTDPTNLTMTIQYFFLQSDYCYSLVISLLFLLGAPKRKEFQ